MIEIFKKLLATKSNATSFFVFSKDPSIINPLEVFSWVIVSIFFCNNENNTTSAPETNLKQNSKTTIPAIQNTRFTSMV